LQNNYFHIVDCNVSESITSSLAAELNLHVTACQHLERAVKLPRISLVTVTDDGRICKTVAPVSRAVLKLTDA
jgi:hypothetical protein